MIIPLGSLGTPGARWLSSTSAPLQSSSFSSFNLSFGRNAPAHLKIGGLEATTFR
jgi:hypothetical protein